MNYEKIWKHAEILPWCVLVTTGRTGTDFFQSLMDSHPEVFVFNGAFYFHTFWQGSPCVVPGKEPDLNNLLDYFTGTHIEVFKSRYDPSERKDQLGESRDQSIDINLAEFKRHVKGLLDGKSITPKNVIIAIYVAYELCLKRDVSRKKLFLHHVHHVRKVDDFMVDFPGSKIICMTRDPRALYVSGVENWRRYNPQTDNPAYPLHILWRAVDEIRTLHIYNNGLLRTLKLEDLAEGKTLHSVCHWLGVSFDPCLKESTWGGMRWWGDKLSKNEIPEDEHGFSKTISTNNWEERIDALDKARLNYLLTDILDWYGYPHQRQDGFFMAALMFFSVLLPTGYERRYLSPGYLFKALFAGNLRKLIAAFYHPLRRMIWFYKLLYRRWFGNFFTVPYLGGDKT